jgi:hypothetical protein
MHAQDRLHGVLKPFQRLSFIGAFAVAPAIAAVDFLILVQEEDHESEVVIELKQVQVHAVDTRQPNPHELVGDLADAFQTDNLPVKFSAIDSRHAAKHHHEGHAIFVGLLEALFETE